jgi:hypothetical protein
METILFDAQTSYSALILAITNIRKIKVFSENVTQEQYQNPNEILSSLERLLVSQVDLDKSLDFAKLSYDLVHKFQQELAVRYSAAETEAIVSSLFRISTTDYGLKSNPNWVPGCNLKSGICTYGPFSQKIPLATLRRLKSHGSDQDVLLGLMSLQSICPGGQQWSMPQKWFNVVREKIGLDLVAYASILNAEPNTAYCSAFDSDVRLGSLGNFNSLDLNTYFASRKGRNTTITMNPPFVETILLKAVERIDEIFQIASKSKSSVRVLFTCPYWKDAVYFTRIQQQKYLKATFILTKGEHFYEDKAKVNNQEVIARANSTLFILDTEHDQSSYSAIAAACKIQRKQTQRKK